MDVKRGVSGVVEVSSFEKLEGRTLLDAVAWDGGAGTSSWNDAGNWVRNGVDALPQDGDVVTIDVPTSPTVTFSGGTVTLGGLITNEALQVTGGELRLASGASADVNAPLTVNGGTIGGGHWDVTGGLLRAGNSNSSVLDGLTLTGDVTLSGGQRVRISNGIEFTDDSYRIRVTGSGGAEIAFVGDTTLNSGGMSFEGSSTTQVGLVGGGTLTLGPGFVVSGGGATFGTSLGGSFPVSVINHGTVLSNRANGSLWFTSAFGGTFENAADGVMASSGTATLAIGSAARSWSNAGAVNAAGTGQLTLLGEWVNTGTISSQGVTVNLGGTFDASSVAGRFVRSGGTVNLQGVLSNEGQLLRLDSGTGAWRLMGGTITGGATGGTLELAGSGLLVIMSDSTNLLERQLVVGADLELGAGSALRLANGVTFADPATQAVRMTASTSATRLYVVGEGSLPGSVVVQGTSGAAYLSPWTDGSLTIPAGAAVSGNAVLGSASPTTYNWSYVNAGTLNLTGAARISPAGTGTFTNTGTVRVQSGALVIGTATTSWSSSGAIVAESGTSLRLDGAWASTGTLSTSNATLDLGGTFSAASVMSGFARSGGTVSVVGILQNAGQTLALTAATGSWWLSNGTIRGGDA